VLEQRVIDVKQKSEEWLVSLEMYHTEAEAE
jgi:hypothetical protein